MLFYLIFLTFSLPEYCATEKIPLNFSYITSITGTGFTASGGIPIVDMALEDINNRSDVLVNYTLKYTTIEDSKCHQSASLDAFFKHFKNDSQPIYISTVCCGCSTATIPVAEISHYWNIPQMSFASAVVLNDRERFRNYFRTLPTNINLPSSLTTIVKHFGWRQMAVISEDQNLFTGLNAALQTLFNVEKLLLDSSVVIDSSANPIPYNTIFETINSGHFRIIFINTYSQFAYNILCEAYYRQLFSPKYVWITHLWYNREWWKTVEKQIPSCPPRIFNEILSGSIGMIPDGYIILENTTAATFSGLTPEDFLEKYQDRLNQSQYSIYKPQPTSAPSVLYDLIWALALGLDSASKKIAQGNKTGCEEQYDGDLVPLEEFNYTNQKIGCILRKSISEVQFDGLSGPIKFNAYGSQPDNVLLVQQYRELDSDGNVERVTVADITFQIEVGETFGIFTFREGEYLWESGIPYDGYPEEVIHPNNTPLFIIYSICASFGMIFIGVCFVFNIAFRNKKIVKLASPNLNYFIIFGAGLLYVCVFLYSYSTSETKSATIICNFQIWLFSLGYTLCFAVILSKVWRVYYIFNNPTPNKKAIKDWVLFIIVSLVLAIDMTILLIGTSIPKSRLEAQQIKDSQHPTHITDDGIIQENFVFICTMNDSVVWLAISFAYKGLLQIIAIFMAFHTRRIKIRALNDSKEIVAIIYINSIILVLLAVSVFVLGGYHDVHAALFGLALLVDASLFLGVLFVPKMISLYRDPKGEKVILHSFPTSNQANMTKVTEGGKSDSEMENTTGKSKGIRSSIS